jgi:two-component system, NarL family, nitrate/nitrite response regulator NarL
LRYFTSLKKKPIRVLLADVHEGVREGLAKLLVDEADREVVGMAADSKQAVYLAERITPDVIIMDVSTPVMNGIYAAKQIIF